jgi:hypothetical protein
LLLLKDEELEESDDTEDLKDDEAEELGHLDDTRSFDELEDAEYVRHDKEMSPSFNFFDFGVGLPDCSFGLWYARTAVEKVEARGVMSLVGVISEDVSATVD